MNNKTTQQKQPLIHTSSLDYYMPVLQKIKLEYTFSGLKRELRDTTNVSNVDIIHQA